MVEGDRDRDHRLTRLGRDEAFEGGVTDSAVTDTVGEPDSAANEASESCSNDALRKTVGEPDSAENEAVAVPIETGAMATVGEPPPAEGGEHAGRVGLRSERRIGRADSARNDASAAPAGRASARMNSVPPVSVSPSHSKSAAERPLMLTQLLPPETVRSATSNSRRVSPSTWK